MSDAWRVVNRAFSREWRRTKTYRLTEIKRLAARRGWSFQQVNRDKVKVTRGQTSFIFQRAGSEEIERGPQAASERLNLFAALRA